MTTRISSLAALVVTFASLALGGCAADADGPEAIATESSISEREAARDVHAARGVTFADLVDQANTDDLRHEVTADAKIARVERPELTPVPGFSGAKEVVPMEALEAVTPAIGQPKVDVEMPALGRR